MSGISVQIHLLREYMKDNIRLSYKIGKSRSVQLDQDRYILIKSYYTGNVI